MRIALDKAIQERADDEKKLASVRQTLAELRKSAQQRDLQIANLNALITREEAAAELADTRAKGFHRAARNTPDPVVAGALAVRVVGTRGGQRRR